MKFTYSKSVLLFTSIAAIGLLAYDLVAGLDPGRAGGSLGKFIVTPMLMLPFSLIADMWAAWRERRDLRAYERQSLQYPPRLESD